MEIGKCLACEKEMFTESYFCVVCDSQFDFGYYPELDKQTIEFFKNLKTNNENREEIIRNHAIVRSSIISKQKLKEKVSSYKRIEGKYKKNERKENEKQLQTINEQRKEQKEKERLEKEKELKELKEQSKQLQKTLKKKHPIMGRIQELIITFVVIGGGIGLYIYAGLTTKDSPVEKQAVKTEYENAYEKYGIIGDANCTDFATQADAQDFFEMVGNGDPNDLDRDGDGIACEWN